MEYRKLRIAAMRSEDIPAVLALETGSSGGWSRAHFEDELRQPAGFQFVVHSAAAEKKVAVLCGRIMVDEAEILKLIVMASARKKGIGSRLLDFALNYCRTRGVKSCFLEMRPSNTAAAKLYEKRGFTEVGTRKNYYTGPPEDAVMLKLGLT